MLQRHIYTISPFNAKFIELPKLSTFELTRLNKNPELRKTRSEEINFWIKFFDLVHFSLHSSHSADERADVAITLKQGGYLSL